MKATIMLADFAQAVGGKLYIMGGGWSITGPMPNPSAIAVKVEVPWNETNRKHRFKLELLNTENKPVLLQTDQGERPLLIDGEFEVGRPAGLIPGSPLDVPLAFNLGAIPLAPGQRYVWRLMIDDKEDENWLVTFSTRPAVQAPTA